jgi:hypothetical protein
MSFFFSGAFVLEQLVVAAQLQRARSRLKRPPWQLEAQPWLVLQVALALVAQPWLVEQRPPNRRGREQAAALLQLGAATTAVVVQRAALQPAEQRLRPKSAVSLPAVKASINTAEYILESPGTKGSQPTR